MSLRVSFRDTESESSDNEFFDLQARTFREMVQVFGTTITFDGLEMDCIAAPAELAFSHEVVGMVQESKIRYVTMLASDFDQFTIVLNQTECVIDDLTMVITMIDRDPQDPCVRFSASVTV
jgi:hypothetical protein